MFPFFHEFSVNVKNYLKEYVRAYVHMLKVDGKDSEKLQCSCDTFYKEKNNFKYRTLTSNFIRRHRWFKICSRHFAKFINFIHTQQQLPKLHHFSGSLGTLWCFHQPKKTTTRKRKRLKKDYYSFFLFCRGVTQHGPRDICIPTAKRILSECDLSNWKSNASVLIDFHLHLESTCDNSGQMLIPGLNRLSVDSVSA